MCGDEKTDVYQPYSKGETKDNQPRFYFGDVCRETTNYILISDFWQKKSGVIKIPTYWRNETLQIYGHFRGFAREKPLQGSRPFEE